MGNKAMKSSTMKYTQRLKLSIAADMIFVTTLVVSVVLVYTEKVPMKNYGLIIAGILVVCGVCLAATLYKERGECRKWRNIWKLPIWQTVVCFLLVAALMVVICAFPESGNTSALLGVLIMVNTLIIDIRYYRNAVRFGMDDLIDVNELANKYPEARPMINRKKKTDPKNN